MAIALPRVPRAHYTLIFSNIILTDLYNNILYIRVQKILEKVKMHYYKIIQSHFFEFFLKFSLNNPLLCFKTKKDENLFFDNGKWVQKMCLKYKKRMNNKTTIAQTVLGHFLLLLANVQGIRCGIGRKLDTNRNIFKLSENRQNRTSVHQRVGLKGLRQPPNDDNYFCLNVHMTNCS